MICLFNGLVVTKSGELIQEGAKIQLTIDDAKNLVRTLNECIEEAQDHNGYVMSLVSNLSVESSLDIYVRP